jgi:predicted DsbA family dithiol-disulfide isomerase
MAGMGEPLVMEVFSDYVCPWCYLSTARIERLKREHNVTVKWVHFPLHPDTPQKGRSLEDLFAGRGYDIPKMQAQMRARMEAEGLPYGDRSMTYNSRLAQELGTWADTQPGGEAIHDALFRAYFVDNRDIGDPEVLVEIAQAVGLPAEEARAVIETRSHKAAVDADWEKSHAYGVTGVPTYVAGGHGVVGAQPYEALEALVKQARSAPRG